jgi:DNA ligase-1
MGCYDPESDEYQSVCKVGTGFKDEDLQRLTEAMQPFIISSGRRPPNYNTDDSLAPDDWFEPQAVWELQAADLSKSSVHRGGIGRLEAGRGIGLR